MYQREEQSEKRGRLRNFEGRSAIKLRRAPLNHGERVSGASAFIINLSSLIITITLILFICISLIMGRSCLQQSLQLVCSEGGVLSGARNGRGGTTKHTPGTTKHTPGTTKHTEGLSSALCIVHSHTAGKSCALLTLHLLILTRLLVASSHPHPCPRRRPSP